MEYFWSGWFVVLALLGALIPKAQTVIIVSAIGLVVVYPSQENGLFITLFVIPAAILAGFRG